MDIMQFVKAGMVVGVVGVIQIIKGIVDQARAKAAEPAIDSNIWVLVVCLSGVVMAIIAAGIDNAWNWWKIGGDVFTYAAAASFVYTLGKAATKVQP
jgi:hypothetical protein